MTVSDLLDALSSLDPTTPVLLATQPAWPMLYDLEVRTVLMEGALYLAAGEQLGYLDHDVANELGW